MLSRDICTMEVHKGQVRYLIGKHVVEGPYEMFLEFGFRLHHCKDIDNPTEEETAVASAFADLLLKYYHTLGGTNPLDMVELANELAA